MHRYLCITCSQWKRISKEDCIIDFGLKSLCSYSTVNNISKALKSVGINAIQKWIFNGKKGLFFFVFGYFLFKYPSS